MKQKRGGATNSSRERETAVLAQSCTTQGDTQVHIDLREGS